MKSVTIYTDGACLGNPGPGGYAVVLLYGGLRKELSGGFRLTTSNRMEIMAAIVGLEALKQRCKVRLHTDSRYLQQSVMLGWAKRWRAKGWKKGDDTRPNWDLWERLLDLCAALRRVRLGARSRRQHRERTLRRVIRSGGAEEESPGGHILRAALATAVANHTTLDSLIWTRLAARGR